MLNVLATMDGKPLILAQPDVASKPITEQSDSDVDGPKKAGDEKDGGGSFLGDPMMMMILIGMVILWIFLLGGGSRKQKKKQQQMLASMSKGAKVITIGGIKGSIVEVREDEIVVKVDENNNTRMKFSRDAIRTVVDGEGTKDTKATKDSADH